MARGDDPTAWEVDDALRADLRPLLAVDEPRKKQGTPRRPHRRRGLRGSRPLALPLPRAA